MALFVTVAADGLIRQYGEGIPTKVEATDTIFEVPDDEVAALLDALGPGENRLDENGDVANTPPPPPDTGPTLAQRLADLEAEVAALKAARA